MEVPQNGRFRMFMMENPIKWIISGYPDFRNPPYGRHGKAMGEVGRTIQYLPKCLCFLKFEAAIRRCDGINV